MPELYLTTHDLNRLKNVFSRIEEKPRSMSHKTWKEIKSADPALTRISMADLRALAKVEPRALIALGIPMLNWDSRIKD